MEIRPILSALLRNKTGPLLVALQIALSLAILANALHLVQVRLADAGRPSGMADEATLFDLTVSDMTPGGYGAELAAQKSASALLRAVPGVLSVAVTNQLPLSHSGLSLMIQAQPNGAPTGGASVALYLAPDSLVATWGLRLLEGRDFTAAEVDERPAASTSAEGLPDVAILTSAMARQLFNDEHAVGKQVYVGISTLKAARVIGVVAHLQTPTADSGPEAEYAIIYPVRGVKDGTTLYSIRSAPGQRERVMRDTEAALRHAAPMPIVVEARSMEQIRATRYQREKGMAWLLLAVCALLLLITASGIVGMASLWVDQRRKQIGVRRALGARRVDILRYFITENLLISTAGVGAGALLALGLNQFLVSQFELARLPPVYLAVGALVFWTLGVVAVYWPAWRGASTSPAVATRSI